MSEKRHVEKGTIVFKENEDGFVFFQVISGKIGIYRNYQTDYVKHLGDRVAGEIFGEMGIIDYRSRSATTVALEDTDLEVYSDKEFDDFLNNNPDKMFDIIDTISDRIRALTKDYEEVKNDIKVYAEAEGANVEPTLLERIMKIVKGK